ncbi:MAG: hypothetical protein QCH96_03505 [Candidatus Thermoplasmatota archaeon]|nr:hypothetical protein [Candidatus Thermoplasmatota archaeon]
MEKKREKIEIKIKELNEIRGIYTRDFQYVQDDYKSGKISNEQFEKKKNKFEKRKEKIRQKIQDIEAQLSQMDK